MQTAMRCVIICRKQRIFMKKEQFDIATQDMHNRVKELVLNQLPTLDGIMQADKMSPRKQELD